MNTSIFALRAFSLNLSIEDMEQMTHGDVVDMLIEQQNDSYDYPYAATQDDFDKFASM